jgi:adenine-specific DNA-methyltransferase
MLAYHLSIRGDSQWRSHPYVTQRVIEEIPVPLVAPESWEWKQAVAIAEAVRAKTRNPTSQSLDLRIEQLVAALYGLDDGDCKWVLRTLGRAQQLEGIRELRLPTEVTLEPLRIAA